MSSMKVPVSIEALAAFLFLSNFSCEAATLRVPGDYPTIQDAINAAARSGDTVLVSPGTYMEVLQLQGKSLTLTSTKGAAETVIVGDTNSPVLWVTLGANESATISGFKFTLGAPGVIAEGRVTLEDNIFTEDFGGVAIDGDDVTVRHNVFTANGGHTESPVDVSGERVLIVDNLIEGNVNSVGCGGGIALRQGSAVVLRNRIDRNSANYGGGICSWSQSVYVSDNLIYDNDAAYMGGGVFITGADSQDKSDGQWINNTISDNLAGVVASQVYMTKLNHRAVIANNVLSATDGSVVLACDDDDASVPYFDNNDIFTTGSTAAAGSCAAAALGGTNLSAPPDFQDGANGHPYHLAPDSPLVDAGSNEAARRLHRDFGNRPRIIDGGHGLMVDIGAIEYRPE